MEMTWVVCWCVYSVYSSLHSHHTNISHLKRGRSGRLFLVYVLGLTTSRDRFWVILLWQDSERAKSFAAYALAFTGTSDIKIHQDTLSALMSLINSYTGSFGRCSTQKTVCTLPWKEMQAQFQRLAGHGQWSWQQRFLGHETSLWTQVRPRNHNTQGRDTEVHQHIQALSRIWTKCGKKQFGKHPCHLPACDAESVCTATSRKSWLALILQSTKCREVNILQSIYIEDSEQIWRFPRKKYTMLLTLIYSNIHWNWREVCQINKLMQT